MPSFKIKSLAQRFVNSINKTRVRSLLVASFFVATVVAILKLSFLSAATFNFIQNDWRGGSLPTPTPPNYVTATDYNSDPTWDEFEDSSNVVTSVDNELTVGTVTTGITDTSDTDFGAGAFSQTDVSGTGDDAALTLQNQNAQDLNTWNEPSSPDVALVSGSASVSPDGGNTIYVMIGGTTDFYRYSVTQDTWTQLTSSPGVARPGAAMAYYNSTNSIYAFKGDSKTFWRYDIDDDTWITDTGEVAETSAIVYSGASMVYPGSGDYIYAFRGFNTTAFWRYSVSSNVWVSMAASPFTVDSGADMVYPGSGDYIYAINGDNGATSTKFMKYSISSDAWHWDYPTDAVAPEQTPDNVGSGGGLESDGGDKIYGLAGGGTSDFWEYDITGGSWSVLADTPTNVDVGGKLIYAGSGDTVFALRGNSTSDFWRYTVSADSWSAISFLGAGQVAGFGAALESKDDGDTLYALRGDQSTDFMSYDISDDSWSSLHAVPSSAYYGADLAYPGSGDTIYATRGGGNTEFWGYSISGDSWSSLNSPGTVSYGGRLEYYPGGTGYVYTLLGGGTSTFKRYSISSGNWELLQDLPGAVDRGSDLVYTGYTGHTNYIYALQGNSTTNLWRYSISGDQWSFVSAAPAAINVGGAMMYPGFDEYIYVFSGNSTRYFWRYSLDSGEWENLTSTPGAVSEGGDLVFPGAGYYMYAFQGGQRPTFLRYAFRADYYGSGTFESQIIDTVENLGFARLLWNPVVPATTTLTVKVRSSDSSTMSGAPLWASCSNITNGADITSSGCVTDNDQYVQYEVSMTTGDHFVSPELEDITVEYEHYAFNSYLLGSPFDTEDVTNVISRVSWDEDTVLPTGTNVKVQLRTAPDDNGSPGTWSSFMGPTSTSDYYDDSSAGCSKASGSVTCNSIHSDHSDAIDDQWYQYKIYFTSTGGNTPTLNEMRVQYVINTPPAVSVTNTPAESTTGNVSITYNVSDVEESSVTVYLATSFGVTLNGVIPDTVSTSDITLSSSDVDQLPTSGAILIDNEMIAYTGRSGSVLTGITRGTNQTRPNSHTSGKSVYLVVTSGVSGATGSQTTGSNKTITWNVASTLSGLYVASGKVKVAAIDGNAANQLGSGEKTLILDTKSPTSPSVVIDSRTDQLTLAATDDSAMRMKISNDSGLAVDGLNADSGQWINFASTKDWEMVLSGGVETVYARFKDVYGNETSTVSSVTPEVPENLILTDISYVYGSDYKIFVAWQVVPEPGPGFAAYDIYVSTEGADPDVYNYNYEASITDIAENFYVDTGLDVNETYYYRVVARDQDGNISNYNTNFGVQDGANIIWGQGIDPGSGGDTSPAPVLSDVAYSDVTETSATITWISDKLSSSYVSYSTTPGDYENEVGVSTMVTDHEVTLTGLNNNTKYYFKVVSYDAASKKGESIDEVNQVFTTLADTTGPVITNITTNTGTDSVGITWVTDESATSQIEYGVTSSYGNLTTKDTALVAGHSVGIINLDELTTYHFRIRSADADGNEAVSDDHYFTTGVGSDIQFDLIAPNISDIKVSSITATSAKVTFTSSEEARGLIEYGDSSTYERGDTSGVLTTLSTSHEILLYNLTPETFYHYRVYAIDSSGNLGVGPDKTFTTDVSGGGEQFVDGGGSSGTNPPAISSGAPSVVNIGSASATIVWTTQEASTSLVFYQVKGSDADPVVTGSGATYTVNHSVKLTGLAPNTTYVFQVKSEDTKNSYVISDLYEFRTEAAPAISNVRVDNIAYETVSIAWESNVPTDSVVEYGAISGEYTDTVVDSQLVQNHQIDLVNLSAGVRYYFIVRGVDDLDNVIISDEYTFTTKAAPSVQDVSIIDLTAISATIGFETNVVATSSITYTNTDSKENAVLINDVASLTHAFPLTDLSANTFYTFTMTITDSADDSYTTEQYSFETLDDAKGPEISLIEVRSSLNEDDNGTVQTIISWVTNESSSSQVQYSEIVGDNVEYDFTSGVKTDRVKDHLVVLTDLKASTAYQFVVVSADESGNSTTSKPNVMLTPGRRVSIFDLIFGSLEETFSWLTRL
ncbi:fibronectin type III domain-containing protein [candidate division WWE3 bacterium]|uniref:Fibronectin type III domain-containing protein n=1 Tax=candidate division WWE3 bacterium TaxID=2053526 RepID=A0A955RRR4_UNCKA|nr:fibronectin type III domain-containing protein [candidate division WWE3 bacterium]